MCLFWKHFCGENMSNLKEYNKKRDFSKTSEPKGSKGQKTKTSKTNTGEGGVFVVQYHSASRVHFDLRLEMDGVLASWAVPKGLSYFAQDKRLAVRVEDHPKEYANFEGGIPKGEYGAGEVLIWDTGVWHPAKENKGLNSGVLKFTLKGKRLKGDWALINISKTKDENNWIIIKEHDKYLNSDDLTKYKTSIKTGKTFLDLKKENKPKRNPFKCIKPMLAKLVEKIPNGNNYLYEIKYDGYRILAYTEANNTTLYTRNGVDFTAKFAGIASVLSEFAGNNSFVLDGEMVVFDKNGKTDFQTLQNSIRKKQTNMVSYVVFDLLALNGKDMRALPIIERKAELEKLLKNAPAGIVYSSHTIGKGKQCFNLAKRMGLEGIIGKEKNSKYLSTRSGDWIKIKCYKRQEFVIAGYTKSDKTAGGIGAILLGYYFNKYLIYCGRAGTGFDAEESKILKSKFSKLKTTKCPFKNPPKTKDDVVWLSPKLVAEIQFAEFTNEKQLRQASYKGLRVDKNPQDVVNEYLN